MDKNYLVHLFGDTITIPNLLWFVGTGGAEQIFFQER
jgi:hypothetical protein